MSHDHTPDVAALLGQELWEAHDRSTERIWSGNPNPRLVEHVADLTRGIASDVGSGEGADAIWLGSPGEPDLCDLLRLARRRDRASDALRARVRASLVGPLPETVTRRRKREETRR